MMTALLGAVIAAGAVGCASPPRDSMATPWAEGQLWRQADSSAVFFTPQARQAMASAGMDPDQLQWYDARQDQRPSVFYAVGQRDQTVRQFTGSYTSSHYGSSRGRVYDSSSTHTYHRRIEITPR